MLEARNINCKSQFNSSRDKSLSFSNQIHNGDVQSIPMFSQVRRGYRAIHPNHEGVKKKVCPKLTESFTRWKKILRFHCFNSRNKWIPCLSHQQEWSLNPEQLLVCLFLKHVLHFSIFNFEAWRTDTDGSISTADTFPSGSFFVAEQLELIPHVLSRSSMQGQYLQSYQAVHVPGSSQLGRQEWAPRSLG